MTERKKYDTPRRRSPGLPGLACWLAACLLCGWCILPARAAVSAQSAVEKQSVTVGEPFVYQIQVKDSENPEKPVIPELEAFSVEFLGEQTNSKQYVSIVNGQVKKVVSRGYVFNYRLTPRKEGRWTIPSVTVRAEGQSAATNPVVIAVTPPRSYDDIKLHLSFSKSTCYVGEPIVMTITWYLSEKVQNARLSVPFLQERDTFFVDEPMEQAAPGAQYYSIPWEGGELTMRAGRGQLGGRTFTTLTAKKVIIPRRPGDHGISGVRAVCQVLKGYQKRRGRMDGFLDDFFSDGFTFGRKAVYESAVVPAPEFTLRVLDLPPGRPADFSGIVGQVKVSVEITPRRVKVGEPMTLSVRYSGMDYVKHIPAPDLASRESFTKGFKVPAEMASGSVEGRSMVFTQTIRPKSDDVTEVPPIETGYFDVKDGVYKTTQSRPIPIEVEAVKVVTLADAEGGSPVAVASVVKSKSGGVAHNYTGLDVLEDQSFSLRTLANSPGWWCALLLPMLMYFGAYTWRRHTLRLHDDPAFYRRRQALNTFKHQAAEAARLLDEPGEFYSGLDRILRGFVADILALPAGRHATGDLLERLRHKGVSDRVLERLASVMDDLDAACFGGASGSRDGRSGMLETVRDVVEKIRREVQA